jgi:AbrB family looped-hinge helix DNA binding protein
MASIEYLRDNPMQTVRLSPKFQVVIPKKLRERLRLRPGQDLVIYEIEGQIRLETPRKAKSLRGLARGLQWKESDRDHAERL